MRLLMLLLLCPFFAQAAQPDVYEKTLDNGLKILVKPDRRSPVAVSQVWYKVGSSYEPGGITGISHMLEHMMFKGTHKHPAGEFSRLIAENGGRENAFTGLDYTAYFQTLEKSRLAISFELEADRMRHLNLLDAEFQKEREVVTEERRMRTDDKPRAKTHEYFMAMAFSNNPYKNPVIGWPSDIAHYTIDDLKAWYNQWYAPNNATLVVVGDVNPDAVFKLAEKYFAPLKPVKIKPVKPQTEVEQLGLRKMTVKLPAKLPYVMLGYKTPSLKTAPQEWEAYALEVLAGILDGGNSARLSSRLVRGQQLAVSAGAGYDLYARMSSLFMLNATPSAGKTVFDLEYALKEQVYQLQRELVSDEELQRVKAQVLADNIYEKDSNFYQAMQLGMLETIGLNWHKADEYVKKIQQVTPEQIRQVARKYLIDDHLSVAYLDPQPIKPSIPSRKVAGGHHAY